MRAVKKNLRLLNKTARACGLEEHDFNCVEEFIEYNEPGLAFEVLIDQMYDRGVKISDDTYKLIVVIASKLNLPACQYDFMKELAEGN